jgi:hypothetical protein
MIKRFLFSFDDSKEELERKHNIIFKCDKFLTLILLCLAVLHLGLSYLYGNKNIFISSVGFLAYIFLIILPFFIFLTSAYSIVFIILLKTYNMNQKKR